MRYQPEDKFVLEIRDTVGRLGDGDIYYEARNYSPVISENELNQLDRLDSDYINEHFEELQDEAYQQGMNDAWELVKKIFGDASEGGISGQDLVKMFPGCYTMRIILDRHTPQEVKSKIEAWEKSKQEIKVGDVVYLENPNKTYVVTYDENGWCGLLTSGGTVATALKERLTKTGRSIDITSVLEQIGGNT